MTAIMWFRRDLRLSDHPALHAAAEAGQVVPLFVHDPAIPSGPAQRRRLDASLAALRDATEGALVVRTGPATAVLGQLAAEVRACSVHVTTSTTPAGRRRDHALAERLRELGVELVRSGTRYAVPPGTVRTGGGTPYRVFTPFSRAWRDLVLPAPVPRPRVRWRHSSAADSGGARATAPAAGEEAALRRWEEFLASGLVGYAVDRDRPDLDATSRMSTHLALGEVHPRTLLADVAAHPQGGGEGARTFVAELCWREFCADVLWHHPDSAWSDLRPDLAGMEHDPEGPLVDAWRRGRTGFPLVDAGMRQLLAEGWMHNRARMVVASFLVKDLHVRWQTGARHFLEHLVDADLASNNHNWQWAAGTGTDAAPYFRVFNPVRQGLRFDPAGAYVRRWVPELAHLPGKAAHEPWLHPDGHARGYSERIVDHDEERLEALARVERLRTAARRG